MEHEHKEHIEHEHKDHKAHEHKEHEPGHKHVQQFASPAAESGMDKKIIVMMVLVGILVLVSAVQAVELVQLKEKLSDESLTFGKATQKTSIGTSGGTAGGSLSKNLENLPSMVGGC